MTFSILAKLPNSRALGGAAATGNLCVGGWVLRGSPEVGMSASQGAAPSTLWGEEALRLMGQGQDAHEALQAVVKSDRGKAERQLAVLDKNGQPAVFSGSANQPVVMDLLFENGVAAGNMLSGKSVISSMVEGFISAKGSLSERLLRALRAAQLAGGDFRGLQSAALLVVSRDHAPLNLRVDLSDDPLTALEMLHDLATSGGYASWAAQLPTLNNPESGLR